MRSGYESAGVGTTSWGGNCSNFPFANLPFASRGGTFYYNNVGADTGTFAFDRGYGGNNANTDFSVVLVP